MSKTPKPPASPAHLGAEGRRLWRSVLTSFELEDHHLVLLAGACEASDRIAQARAAIVKYGLVYEDDKGNPHPRPEVAIERDSTIRLARLLRELNLDGATVEQYSRPPMIAGGGRYGRRAG